MLAVRFSLLRVNQNPVVNDDGEIVLPVACEIHNKGFTRLLCVAPAATTKAALLKDCPPIGGNQLAIFAVDHHIEVILRCLEKDEILALVLVQIAANHVVQTRVLNWRFVSIQFRELPRASE